MRGSLPEGLCSGWWMVETRFMSDQREDPVGHRFDSVDFEQVLDELRGPGTVEDEYWERIWALQRRVGRGTFDRCVGLLNGPDGLDRRIGADVLSQLGYRDDKPWADESIPHLLSRLEDSTDEDALVGIAGAFQHLGYGDNEDHRRMALSRLRELCGHPDADVRESVVSALHAAVDGPDTLSLEAVLLLCELTRDGARDVRDWATFWLMELPEKGIDLPEVRAALWARITDKDQEIRVQAINGLANHGDRDVLPYLLEELLDELVDDDALQWLDTFEAATTLADPVLLPLLRRLLPIMKEEPWISECQAAIAACEAARPLGNREA